MRHALGSAVLLLTTACTTMHHDSCVAEGVIIATPDGPRPIESLRVGDSVWAVDPRTRERVRARISAVRTATRECLALELGDGASLVCTPDHPVYDPDADQYVLAVRWLEGHATRILRVDDDGARVEGVVSVSADAGLRRVFDLTVESEHHDFVANGVLVHNKSPGCLPSDPPCDETGLATDDATTDGDTDSSSSGGDTTTSSGTSESTAASEDTDSSSEDTDATSEDTGSSSEDTGTTTNAD